MNWIRLVFFLDFYVLFYFSVLSRSTGHSNAATEMSVLAISSWSERKCRQLTSMCTRAHPTIAAVNLWYCFIEAYYLFIPLWRQILHKQQIRRKVQFNFLLLQFSHIYCGFCGDSIWNSDIFFLCGGWCWAHSTWFSCTNRHRIRYLGTAFVCIVTVCSCADLVEAHHSKSERESITINVNFIWVRFIQLT